MVSSRWFLTITLSVFAVPNASGFVSSHPSTTAPLSIAANKVISVVPTILPITHGTLVSPLKDSIRASPSNEASRQYRRTVYSHEDWPEHRSPKRFQKAVETIFISQIYRGLSLQVATFSFIATFTVVWNCLAGGYVDFDNVLHEPLFVNLPILVLPLQVFTLTSGSLGLLLGKYSGCDLGISSKRVCFVFNAV